MKVKSKIPIKQYPYLAVWTGQDPSYNMNNIDKEDIVIIDMVDKPSRGKVVDKPTPYVKPLFKAQEGYFTTHEKEYTPLPAGYKIIITQENV